MQPTTMSSPPQQEAERRGVTAASLRRIPFFREVPDDVLIPLAAASAREVLGRGTVLWEPGSAIEAVFALAVGIVRLYRHLDNGTEVTVALLNPGQVCGMADLDLDAAFVPTTVAQVLFDQTVIYHMPRRAFVRFLLANSTIALRAVTAACQRARDAYDLLALPDARARVAYVLAHLATANRERTVWLTHEELAPLAGVGREAITRYVLPDLRRRGLIAYGEHRRGIRVLDSAQLLNCARCSV